MHNWTFVNFDQYLFNSHLLTITSVLSASLSKFVSEEEVMNAPLQKLREHPNIERYDVKLRMLSANYHSKLEVFSFFLCMLWLLRHNNSGEVFWWIQMTIQNSSLEFKTRAVMRIDDVKGTKRITSFLWMIQVLLTSIRKL